MGQKARLSPAWTKRQTYWNVKMVYWHIGRFGKWTIWEFAQCNCSCTARHTRHIRKNKWNNETNGTLWMFTNIMCKAKRKQLQYTVSWTTIFFFAQRCVSLGCVYVRIRADSVTQRQYLLIHPWWAFYNIPQQYIAQKFHFWARLVAWKMPRNV